MIYTQSIKKRAEVRESVEQINPINRIPVPGAGLVGSSNYAEGQFLNLSLVP